MIRLVFALAVWLSVTAAALAQNATVIGPITPGDCTMFSSTTILKDGGIPCPGSGGTFNLPNGTTATTQAVNDNTTKVATDAFVQQQVAVYFITCPTSKWISTIGVAGSVCTQPAFTDISGSLASSQLPAPFTNGTASGNTNKFATTTGTLTNGDCVKVDASGNFIDNGGICNVAALPQAIPGGRLVLQMSNGVGGVPTVDVPALATKVIVLLPGTVSWKVPADFTSTNTVSALGASGGSAGSAAAGNGGASAGGAYSSSSNLSLTPGNTITVNVPAGGAAGAAGGANSGTAAGDTYFNGANCAGATVCAKPGGPGNGNASASTGGASGSGQGTTKFSGGNSGTGSGSTGGAGGGGAAGPSGAGGNGANGSGTNAGAGGSGDNGVVAGGTAPGGAGVPATIGTDSITQKVGALLSGGGGATSATPAAACGAGYGGGVGGGSNGGAGQTGCGGLIVITYTPSPTIIQYVSCGTYVAGCGSPNVPYYNGVSMALGTFSAGSGGLSLTLTTGDNTAGNCYEIFYFNNSGSPTIATGPALTSCTPSSLARAATGGISLTPDGSILSNTTNNMTIKNNGSSFSCPTNQCTVLGMIHVPVNGQVPMQIKMPAVSGGGSPEAGLDNYYNQIPLRIQGQDSTSSWAYNLTTARSANNSANNAISVLDGLGVKFPTYGYWTSVTSNAAWAGTPELTLNQTCATGISGGGGQGTLVVQGAGAASGDGSAVMTFYQPYPIAGLTKMTACDGAVNASLTVFGNDFMQYYVDTRM